MEHKLDELQQQGSRLGPTNLANHDQLTQLEHEVQHLTAENEVRLCVAHCSRHQLSGMACSCLDCVTLMSVHSVTICSISHGLSDHGLQAEKLTHLHVCLLQQSAYLLSVSHLVLHPSC